MIVAVATAVVATNPPNPCACKQVHVNKYMGCLSTSDSVDAEVKERTRLTSGGRQHQRRLDTHLFLFLETSEG